MIPALLKSGAAVFFTVGDSCVSNKWFIWVLQTNAYKPNLLYSASLHCVCWVSCGNHWRLHWGTTFSLISSCVRVCVCVVLHASHPGSIFPKSANSTLMQTWHFSKFPQAIIYLVISWLRIKLLVPRWMAGVAEAAFMLIMWHSAIFVPFIAPAVKKHKAILVGFF